MNVFLGFERIKLKKTGCKAVSVQSLLLI